MNRQELKALSKAQAMQNITPLILISLIQLAASLLGLIPTIGFLANILVSAPLGLGLAMVYLRVANNLDVDVSYVFEGFQDFWASVKLSLLMGLFIALWSFLFIIPGIIKTYSYSMSIWILAENKGMGAREAINRSKAMMEGHKMELFLLSLSFFGWLLLVGLTFGLAGIWVYPYMYTTFANFYNRIKPAEQEAEVYPEL